jgi:hypothetical protein
MIKRHDIRPRRKRGTIPGVERGAADPDAGEDEDFPGSQAAAGDNR